MGVIPRSELGRLLSPSPSIWNLWVHSRFEPSAHGFLVRLLTPECHAYYCLNGSTERESIEDVWQFRNQRVSG